jgi:hypothetical protein
VFTSERGAPFTTAGFARMVERAGSEAKLAFKAHPHMLRHACGYALANRGHDTRALQAYLGHRNIQHTVRYSELARRDSRTFGGVSVPRTSEGSDVEMCRGFSSGSSNSWPFRDPDPRVCPAKREPHHTRLLVLPQPKD